MRRPLRRLSFRISAHAEHNVGPEWRTREVGQIRVQELPLALAPVRVGRSLANLREGDEGKNQLRTADDGYVSGCGLRMPFENKARNIRIDD
jgi:hypothetical protein